MTVWIESPFDSLPIEGYRKQRYWMMAEAFVRAGHSVVYWTSDFSHATKAKREVEKRGGGGQGNFPLFFVPTRPYSKNVCLARIRSHRAYARTWERMAVEAVDEGQARPDVIVVSSPPVSTGPVAMRLARRFGAKLVVDIQDAWPETFYRLLPRGLRWMAWLLLSGMRRTVGATYRAADLVTGVCERYEALAKGYGARDYYRAYLGIEGTGNGERGTGDRGVEKGEGRMADGEGRRTKDEVRLVYVGNLGRSYDLKTVVAGVELLNRRGVRTTLEVAGFGGSIAASDHVRFHGMLGREELQRLLVRCDVGIIPMQADSFVGLPNKLAEYALAGLRIVSSLQGETEQLLAKYGCGVTYRVKSAESFADAVMASLKLPGDASRQLAEQEFSADRIYSEYCKRICST